eukprot:742723-Pelagomonas_calceolata.AAC.1
MKEDRFICQAVSKKGAKQPELPPPGFPTLPIPFPEVLQGRSCMEVYYFYTVCYSPIKDLKLSSNMFITALSNQKRIIYKQPRSDPVLKEDLPFKGLPMRNSVLECP